MVKKKRDIVTIKNILGHSSLKTTDRYTHIEDSEKQETADILSDSLFKKKK